MKKTSAMLVWALILVFCVFPLTNLSQSEGEEGKVFKLSKNLFRVTFATPVFVNLVLFTGPEGILLVDTGEKHTGGQLESVVKKHQPARVKYIINTHLHEDHTGGNEVLGKNAVIINFDNLSKWHEQGIIFPGQGGLTGKTGTSFATYYSLFFNNEEIIIIPAAGGHSGEDVIVFFKDSGIVHLGDLLFSDSFPLILGSLNKYQKILKKAIDIFPTNTTFIAGHGKDYSMADMKNYYKMVIDTREMVEKELKAGKNIQAIKDANILKKWGSFGNTFPMMNTDDWIDTIYQAYLRKK